MSASLLAPASPAPSAAEGEAFEVVSPIDGTVYARRRYAAGAEIEAALAAAERAAPGWRATPIEERIAVVAAFVAEMEKRAPALAEALARQIGRPLWQADEMPRLKLVTGLAATAAAEVLADKTYPADAGIRRYVRREPLGVMLSICAWNYPTAMLGLLVVEPLLAGNVVILKHSPQTPLIAEIAAEAFAASGGPAGVFQALHMAHPDAEAIIASGRLGAVGFIGSVAGGRRVHAAAGGTFTHVHLELGGKDPAYVRADADLARAVPLLVEGAFSNAGQSCCSVERIYVHADIRDRFVDALTAEAATWTLGQPMQGTPHIGPVVRASAAAGIRERIADAVARGARKTLADDRFGAAGLGPAYVEPQVLVDCDGAMPIMRDELFGPVACVETVASDEAAIARMNDSAYGLTASVWSADIDRAEAIADAAVAGTVYVNRCDHADLYLPWGGVKSSGLGRGNGRTGIERLTETKSFHVRARYV